MLGNRSASWDRGSISDTVVSMAKRTGKTVITPGGWLKTTLYLAQSQYDALRDIAHEEETTISALVRKAIDLHLTILRRRRYESVLHQILQHRRVPEQTIKEVLSEFGEALTRDSEL